MNAIADVGRWQLRSPASDLVREAVATVLVIKPSLDGVAHARSQVADLQRICRRVEVACVGDRPYGADEVADALAVDHVTVTLGPPGRRVARYRTRLRQAGESVSADAGDAGPRTRPRSRELVTP